MYFGYHWRLPNASKQMERHMYMCCYNLYCQVCQLIEAVTSSVVIILLLMYYFLQVSVINGTFLGLKVMKDGIIVNIASMGGKIRKNS